MPYAIGVDIGGTNVKAALVAADGSVAHAWSAPTPPGGAPAALVEVIASAVGEVAAGAECEVLGAGVAVAGFLDPTRSRMVYNANLQDLADFPLREALEHRLSMRCALEVDSNAAVIAEYHFGAGRGAKRLLGVTIGTGLGGGVVIDGALLRYCGECAGDLGHILVRPNGRRCPCGALGCLEAYVSAPALEEAGGAPTRDLIARAQSGEPRACAALSDMGDDLGVGLASLANLFAPDRIVVGGGVAAAGDLLLAPARAAFLRVGAPHFTNGASIVQAAFKGIEGVVGAASALFPNQQAGHD